MNLALSESLGQELRFAKRINSNGATKAKQQNKQTSFTILDLGQFLQWQKLV